MLLDTVVDIFYTLVLMSKILNVFIDSIALKHGPFQDPVVLKRDN